MGLTRNIHDNNFGEVNLISSRHCTIRDSRNNICTLNNFHIFRLPENRTSIANTINDNNSPNNKITLLCLCHDTNISLLMHLHRFFRCQNGEKKANRRRLTLNATTFRYANVKSTRVIIVLGSLLTINTLGMISGVLNYQT